MLRLLLNIYKKVFRTYSTLTETFRDTHRHICSPLTTLNANNTCMQEYSETFQLEIEENKQKKRNLTFLKLNLLLIVLVVDVILLSGFDFKNKKI